jgi:hypothetical protein
VSVARIEGSKQAISAATLFFVMRGLDPRIHAEPPHTKSGESAWIAGSSPAMTKE